MNADTWQHWLPFIRDLERLEGTLQSLAINAPTPELLAAVVALRAQARVIIATTEATLP